MLFLRSKSVATGVRLIKPDDNVGIYSGTAADSYRDRVCSSNRFPPNKHCSMFHRSDPSAQF